ncbi:MAG: amidase domain-containing protein [Oscillospiraceae bacterium]|nr:amidase domain-containing protein [Oscillospiraceae bacterium]
MRLTPYDRDAAVRYAHRWAYGRNPRYYDYEELGGDCTNFASQCLFAGSRVMDYTPTYGWYYIDANRKAPAWTGVPYLFNYLTRTRAAVGPVARDTSIFELEPGDIVQLSFDGARWAHSPVVVAVGAPRTPDNVLLAAHSYDADDRPLSSYEYVNARFLHVYGVYRW